MLFLLRERTSLHEFDLNKGIVIKKSNANYNLHIKPADVKVQEARAAWGWKMHSNRSPNAKVLECQRLLSWKKAEMFQTIQFLILVL